MPTPKPTVPEPRLRGQATPPGAAKDEVHTLRRQNGATAAVAVPLPDPTTRTPLPGELNASDLEQLRRENAELRALMEQAIAQEEAHERQASAWLAREAELVARLESSASGDQVELLQQIITRDESIQQLTIQVQQLESQLQYLQESGGGSVQEELLRAVRERDELIQSTAARVAELEQQLAAVPPPAPSDEELARMADELEKERCQITVLRRELEDEKKQHVEEQGDFERQMREMEVQMSRERAEMARQRMELQRLQSEIHSHLDAVQRGDSSLKDRLAAFQRRQGGGESASGRLPAPQSGSMPPPAGPKDSGFMRKFFGGSK